MGTLFNDCVAKKIFTRSFIAAYKDRGINLKEIGQWIKLTLYFEDPTNTLKSGMIYFETIPKYIEQYQTGLCLFAFGFYSNKVTAFQKYWQHEWIVTASLGKETIDHYSFSPLIKLHDFSHVTNDLIQNSLTNFIGTIEQFHPRKLYEIIEPVDNNDENIMEIDEKSIPSRKCFEKTPMIKQCYSIEFLDRQKEKIQLRIKSDGLFSCRSFIRDLGYHLNCPSSIDSAHLYKLGPINVEQSLQKYEIHYDQMVKSANEITPLCVKYLKYLRDKYPDAKKTSRFI